MCEERGGHLRARRFSVSRSCSTHETRRARRLPVLPGTACTQHLHVLGVPTPLLASICPHLAEPRRGQQMYVLDGRRQAWRSCCLLPLQSQQQCCSAGGHPGHLHPHPCYGFGHLPAYQARWLRRVSSNATWQIATTSACRLPGQAAFRRRQQINFQHGTPEVTP